MWKSLIFLALLASCESVIQLLQPRSDAVGYPHFNATIKFKWTRNSQASRYVLIVFAAVPDVGNGCMGVRAVGRYPARQTSKCNPKVFVNFDQELYTGEQFFVRITTLDQSNNVMDCLALGVPECPTPPCNGYNSTGCVFDCDCANTAPTCVEY